MTTSMIDTTHHGTFQYIDSREVAEMVEKSHKELLRDIRRYTKQLMDAQEEFVVDKEKNGLRKIAPSEFWLDSTFFNSQNKAQPCYLVTKKGCEFIAHKMTGTKGTAFTARYIERFHEMEEALKIGLTTTGQSGLVPAEQILPVLTEITQKLDNSLQRQEAFIQRQNETNVKLIELLIQISSHLEELTFNMK